MPNNNQYQPDIAGFQSLFRSPARGPKPRSRGLTHMMDKGIGITEARSVMEVGAEFIDIVKLGWATSVVAGGFEEKLALYRSHGVQVCCGGTLFEIALQRGKVDEFIAFLKHYSFDLIEISDGVIPMESSEKLALIERFSRDFRVLSEVGSKDTSVVVAPSRWVKAIRDELSAGAWKVIAEGRESGTTGLYRESGEIRHGLIEDIEAQIDPDNMIFECPQRFQQTWMIKHFGANVNLGNIPPYEIVPLETLRQGLRADTMMLDLKP